MRAAPDERELAIRSRALELLGRGANGVEGAWAEGRALDLTSALEVATGAVGQGFGERRA